MEENDRGRRRMRKREGGEREKTQKCYSSLAEILLSETCLVILANEQGSTL